ncbi:MORC family CW-type zinc finger protein 3-like, partial [Patella vulgata]|uniref:MORC family CW-type zinc finger protein 3-like n=1 Tax=Patella vulgata TaxID=6465 RepID=UPI0024A9EE02
RSESVETVNNIQAITSFSSFNTEERLLAELEELSDLQTGTRIILYNLKADNTGKLELDFESDPTDILNPQTLEIDLTSVYRPVQESVPLYCISLREYCSILFLKPRMKIVLRGKKVKTKLICKSLSQTETDRYKPHWLDKPLKITYGFTCSESSNEEYGIMMYHKNRLIKAFEKVGYQKQPNDLGVGVVGVVEVNFLQPIHNKQDFNKDERYNTFMSALAIKTNEYWNEKKSGSNSVSTNLGANPDWLWAQCDNCLKWRRLPDGINRQLPDKWYCYMNPDASHNRCEIIEEPEDEDLSLQHASYQKTFKKEMEQQKRKTRVEGHQMLIKKEKELIEKEEKLKQRVKTVEQICTEVTSTQIQERKKTEGLRRMLLDAKKREANQRKLILELQMKKSQVNKNQKELCKAAESLRVSNFETTALLEDASELTDGPTVSSTSGMKRKTMGSDITVSKRLIIKKEDTDEVVAVIPDSDEVIDLTEEDEQIIIPDPKLVQKNQLMEDIKPNIEELEAQVGTSEKEVSTGEIETQTDLDLDDSNTNPSKDKTLTEKQDKDLDVTKIELEDTKLKLEDANKRLKDLQNNVHSLLSIIVPGVDLGEATEIETIVTEMIRVNQESS